MLGYLVLLLWGQGGDDFVLEFSSVFGLLPLLLLVVLILLLQAHAVGFEEEVLSPQMFDVLEVGLQLLGKLLYSKQLLAFLSGLKFAFGHFYPIYTITIDDVKKIYI